MATTVPTGSLITPGGDQGPSGAMLGVSTDPGNLTRLGSDNHIYTPSQRFNAISNPNFECNQRLPGVGQAMAAGTNGYFALDRWVSEKAAATAVFNTGQTPQSPPVLIPGTTTPITRSTLALNVTTSQATLAASEYIRIYQNVEGHQLRELISSVHSISVLAYCTQAITFTVFVQTVAAPYYTLTKLCTTVANQFTLFTLPNLPVWASGGTWSVLPGNVGYIMGVGLGAGATYTSPANDTWQTGQFWSGPGTTNFASLSAGASFQLAFVQHEPGPVCTSLIDKPFAQNYQDCLRYYVKSYDYGTAINTATTIGCINMLSPANYSPWTHIPFKVPMAKSPTITGYSTAGGINSVYDAGAGGPRGISSAATPGLNSFGGFSTSSTNAAVTQYIFHYTADTGW